MHSVHSLSTGWSLWDEIQELADPCHFIAPHFLPSTAHVLLFEIHKAPKDHHLITSVAASKLLYGLVSGPGQLQGDVTAATLVGNTAGDNEEEQPAESGEG